VNRTVVLRAFIVPGGFTWPQAMEDEPLLAALRAGAARSRRVMSVCAGAFLLGTVGLLDGRRATTHWQFLDDPAQRFPTTTVERGPIFVGDGELFTSAGGTASIDLALDRGVTRKPWTRTIVSVAMGRGSTTGRSRRKDRRPSVPDMAASYGKGSTTTRPLPAVTHRVRSTTAIAIVPNAGSSALPSTAPLRGSSRQTRSPGSRM
jgi:transcriptional regulator GlxA family with amidase domain